MSKKAKEAKKSDKTANARGVRKIITKQIEPCLCDMLLGGEKTAEIVFEREAFAASKTLTQYEIV